MEGRLSARWGCCCRGPSHPCLPGVPPPRRPDLPILLPHLPTCPSPQDSSNDPRWPPRDGPSLMPPARVAALESMHLLTAAGSSHPAAHPPPPALPSWQHAPLHAPSPRARPAPFLMRPHIHARVHAHTCHTPSIHTPAHTPRYTHTSYTHTCTPSYVHASYTHAPAHPFVHTHLLHTHLLYTGTHLPTHIPTYLTLHTPLYTHTSRTHTDTRTYLLCTHTHPSCTHADTLAHCSDFPQHSICISAAFILSLVDLQKNYSFILYSSLSSWQGNLDLLTCPFINNLLSTKTKI